MSLLYIPSKPSKPASQPFHSLGCDIRLCIGLCAFKYLKDTLRSKVSKS